MNRSICPNVQCPDKRYYEIGWVCPNCGTLIEKLGFMDIVKMMNRKDEFARKKAQSASDAAEA